MAFTVSPSQASAPSQSDSTQTPQAPASARERAIAKLMGTQAPQAGAITPAQSQETPVPNASKVAPEDMTGVLTGKKAPEAHETDGQNAKVDSQKPTEATETAKDDPLSSQYAILARKEKAYRQKVQEAEASLKAREEALKAQEASIAAKDAEYQSKYVPKERLSKEALAVLGEMGITYDQLTEQAINQPAPEQAKYLQHVAKLETRIQELEGKIEASNKTYEDNQQKAYKNAVTQLHNETQKLVESSDDFEAIRTTESAGDVVDLIEKTFKETGQLLTVEEAAKQVEEYLVNEAFRLAQMRKIKTRMTAPSAPVDEKKPAPSEKPKETKTLNNSMSTQRPLTARERAILAFEGKKQQ